MTRGTVQFGTTASGPVATFAQLAQAKALWNAGEDPATIQVTATAGAGSKNVQLKVFPDGDVTVNLFNDKVKAALARIKKAKDIAEKLASIAGQRITTKFLEKAKMQFILAYKEVDKDYQATSFLGVAVDPVYQCEVNRRWSLDFKFDPLLKVHVKFCIPVATVIPVVGSAVATGLRVIGVAADVCVNLEVFYSPSIAVAWTERNDISVIPTLNDVQFKFYGSFEVRAHVVEVTLQAGAEGAVRFSDFKPDLARGVLLCVKMTGEVQLYISGAARAGLLGVKNKPWREVSWKPSWGKWGDKTATRGFYIPLARVN